MKRYLPVITASVVLIVAGLVHGFWTDRWVPPKAANEAAERLADVPLVIGDWVGQDVKVESPQNEVAGCIQRCYTSGKQTVVMFLVCGRPGPVSIHTPEACYGAGGFDVGLRKRTKVSDGELWTADAIRTRATEETRLRLYWAWNAGEGWTAPEDARPTFAHRQVLHKLYVQRDLSSLGESTADDPCETFLKVLLPALDRTLFARDL
jgi:hypothetical protein